MENGSSSSCRPAICRIGETAWQKYLQKESVPRDFMNKLVLRYLVEQGHRAAAEQFCRESGSVSDVELRYERLLKRLSCELLKVIYAINSDLILLY